ncbi:MAG: dTDP-glucose 4,6-dehydratase [Chitinivibrionales bacterium]|nr:dTDP-glucose 4,6-dehydratase [Chitinivibrionales bacterium]
MNKVLVTGGAGFIGSNFIHHVLKENESCSVLNLDLLTYAGNLDNLEGVSDNPRYTFCKGSITDRPLIERLFKEHEFDTVVHFAAESHVDRSIMGPEAFVNTNILGTQVLLDVAKVTWDNQYADKRFVHVSTDEVYGSLGKEGLFTETTPISPNSPYSASKAGSDLMARAYFETYGLPVMITRCSNNYGPYQYPEKLIPVMIINALNDRPLPIYGDGMYVRDWLYVIDHCSAIYTVLRNGTPGEVYNIGGNNEMKNIEIVKLILKELNKPESLIRHVTDRLGHDRRYAIDASKMREKLGWSPSVTFDQGISMTIKWYLDNMWWWKKLLEKDEVLKKWHG